MFEIYCPTHRSRVLLGTRRIERMRNTSDGPVVEWRCWCGARGTLLRGGATGATRAHRHPDVGVAA